MFLDLSDQWISHALKHVWEYFSRNKCISEQIFIVIFFIFKLAKIEQAIKTAI